MNALSLFSVLMSCIIIFFYSCLFALFNTLTKKNTTLSHVIHILTNHAKLHSHTCILQRKIKYSVARLFYLTHLFLYFILVCVNLILLHSSSNFFTNYNYALHCVIFCSYSCALVLFYVF